MYILIPADASIWHPTHNRRRFGIQIGSGKQMLNYDELGNISEQIRTFAIPDAPNTYTFKMNFEYDSWNRMQRGGSPLREIHRISLTLSDCHRQSFTYPDGEVVSYFTQPLL